MAFIVVQCLQLIRVIHFPLDEILIYATSLCIVIPFIFEFLSPHYVTPDENKFWSHAALIFTTLYAMFVTANYVIQLATVIPMKLKSHSEDIRILEQTPHSLFLNFDAINYILMGLTTLIAIPAFENKGFPSYHMPLQYH